MRLIVDLVFALVKIQSLVIAIFLLVHRYCTIIYYIFENTYVYCKYTHEMKVVYIESVKWNSKAFLF